MTRFLLYTTLIFASGILAHAQQVKTPGGSKMTVNESASAVRASPAYAEMLLRKTELQADLESLVLEYTEEFPKVKEIRFTLSVFQKEAGRLISLKSSEAPKLTLALGKLIVRKIELETDMWGLLKNYKEDHPDVKRAKRKIEIYEAAIREILG